MEISHEALGTALSFLQNRDRSVAEVSEKLRSSGYAETDIDAVIERLCQRGILDDERLARSSVEAAAVIGIHKLRKRLEHHKLDAMAIAQTISGIDDESQLNSMAQLIEKKRFQHTDRAKAGRFLLNRGFEQDLVEVAIQRQWGEGSDDA